MQKTTFRDRDFFIPDSYPVNRTKLKFITGDDFDPDDTNYSPELINYIRLDRKHELPKSMRMELFLVAQIAFYVERGFKCILSASIVHQGMPRVNGKEYLCKGSIREAIVNLEQLGFIHRIMGDGALANDEYVYLSCDVMPDLTGNVDRDDDEQLIQADEEIEERARIAEAVSKSDDLPTSVILDNAAEVLMNLGALYRDIEAGNVPERWEGVLVRDYEEDLWCVVTKLNGLIQKHHKE